jgi:hypothetical protein
MVVLGPTSLEREEEPGVSLSGGTPHLLGTGSRPAKVGSWQGTSEVGS